MDPRARLRAGRGDRAGDRGLKADVAIETSSRPGSVALAVGARRKSAFLSGGRAHASDLYPALAALCAELGCELARGALGTVFVGIGPGSYTGLRVGIACAQGLAYTSGARLVGVPSFEVLALAGLNDGEEGLVACDARAGAYACARYRREADGVVERAAARAVAHGALAAELAPAGAPLVALGDERALAELARDAPRCERRALPVADALALFALGAARPAARVPQEVEPLYLRAFGT